jgi:P27 family predicted phage terminase small subunit
MVRRQGYTMMIENGRTFLNPAVAAMHKARDSVDRYGQQLGLTPAARTRIRVPEKRETAEGKRRFFGDAG